MTKAMISPDLPPMSAPSDTKIAVSTTSSKPVLRKLLGIDISMIHGSGLDRSHRRGGTMSPPA